MVVQAAGLDAAGEYFVSMAVAEGTTPVALTDLDELAAKAKVQIWRLEEAIETDGREFILMVLKNDLVTANAKVKVTAADLRTLKHEIFRAVLPEGLVSLSCFVSPAAAAAAAAVSVTVLPRAEWCGYAAGHARQVHAFVGRIRATGGSGKH